MNPQIFYWKWQEIDEETIMKKARDIVKRSNFTHIYISMHNIPISDRILSSEKIVNVLNKCARYFKEHGMGIICDVDFTRERKYVKDNDLPQSGFVKFFECVLDDEGKAEIVVKSADALESEKVEKAGERENNQIVNCYAVFSGADKNTFKSPVDISEYAELSGGKLVICAPREFANRNVISYLCKFRDGYPDIFSDEYIDGTRKIFEKIKNIPLSGAATDEFGLGFCLESEYKIDPKELKPIDCLDINKVNYFEDWFPYSDGMRKRYFERYGSDIKTDLLYFWHTEENNFEKSAKIVNQYFENIRTQVASVDEDIYNLTKEYIGDGAFVGTHATMWGDELDNNFDAYHNGLDWWETKRDYAQTDEVVIIPLRLGIARKCKHNVWYNMWYSMRTLDIKTYYKETYCNAIYGGRTHYLGYECNEPGTVLELKHPGYVEKISEMEEKIKMLNNMQFSRPDSRVLVVFGYEAATNHYISDPGVMRIERRGTVIHNVLKTTKEIFMYPYLCELIPSTEIQTDNFSIKNSKAVYCGHEYDAVVFLYPDGITQKVYDILHQMYNDGVNLIVAGDISRLHNGEKVENIFKNRKFYHENVCAKQITDDLDALDIPKNHGDNWCLFEDGSITVSNINADLNVGNGIEYNGKKYNADILYINSDGVCSEI